VLPPAPLTRSCLRTDWRAAGRTKRVNGSPIFGALQVSAAICPMCSGARSIACFRSGRLRTHPFGLWMQALTRYLSPYDFNPLNINPLKDLIERFVNFDAVRACKELQLFVSATNVRTGELHVFRRDEMTADMIVASACLPHLFRAVEIEGEPYWDGGYTGNPALYPLIGATQTENLLLVQINPLQRKKLPKTQDEILARINEITFNSSWSCAASLSWASLSMKASCRVVPVPGSTAVSTCIVLRSPARHKRWTQPAGSAPTMISSKCCARTAGAPRAASWTRITMTSVCARVSISKPSREPRARDIVAYDGTHHRNRSDHP